MIIFNQGFFCACRFLYIRKYMYLCVYKITYKTEIKMKKVSQKIIDLILTDNGFSLDIARILDIQQYSVKELAKRNSDKLTNYHVVEFYKSKGFSLEEIFEA